LSDDVVWPSIRTQKKWKCRTQNSTLFESMPVVFAQIYTVISPNMAFLWTRKRTCTLSFRQYAGLTLPSRTEHTLMSTALFLCCKDISVLQGFDSADHRPLFFPFFLPVFVTAHWQVRFWEEGKRNTWLGGMSTKTHLFDTCFKMRPSSNLFGTLYAIKNINPATNTS
jgi:hypothetical protein